jgi:glutaminyl-tRNA synthetase
VRCSYYPDSRSGSPGADHYKVKGNIHWVSARHAYGAPVHLYDRLFKVAQPGDDFVADLNPHSKRIIAAQLEPALGKAEPGERFQFERHGYFIAESDGFTRTVTLRDSWAKG